MSSIHNERYDEIKSLLKKSRLLFEQPDERINVAKDIEDRLDTDLGDEDEFETADDDSEEKGKKGKDMSQKYRISGGILALHGRKKADLDITTDDKLAFQETMDEFVNEVSDLVDFNTLNVYQNNVDWSGKVIDEDIEFTLTIGEKSGIYITGNMVKVDEDFLSLISRLQQFYQKFKSKWAKIIANRKKTQETDEE
jgi:hypothetical protein